jgi:hypothetical protein
MRSEIDLVSKTCFIVLRMPDIGQSLNARLFWVLSAIGRTHCPIKWIHPCLCLHKRNIDFECMPVLVVRAVLFVVTVMRSSDLTYTWCVWSVGISRTLSSFKEYHPHPTYIPPTYRDGLFLSRFVNGNQVSVTLHWPGSVTHEGVALLPLYVLLGVLFQKRKNKRLLLHCIEGEVTCEKTSALYEDATPPILLRILCREKLLCPSSENVYVVLFCTSELKHC